MRDRRVHGPALLAACALLQVGCAASVAPRGWLPYAREAQQEAYGAWMDMDVMGAGVTLALRGELLAIGEDSVFTVSGDTVTATALTSVSRAKLEAYDPQADAVTGPTVLGTLASPTAGVLLVALAPLWVIVGTSSGAQLSAEGKHQVDTWPRSGAASGVGSGSKLESWRELRLFARFPQGMPKGLDRTQLRERPLARRERPKDSNPSSISE